MTALAVLATVAAVLVWMAPRGGRVRSPDRGRPRRRWGPAVAVITAAALVGLAEAVSGPRLAALLAAGLLAAGTALAVLGHHRADGRALRCRREVARAAGSLAVQLRVGLVAPDALQNAARDWPVLAEAAAAQRLGSDPAAVWRQQARTPGCRGLAELARAWQLCTRTGAPLAPAMERVADELEAAEALGLTVTTELAAARATGRIMAVLPLVGVGLGYALGGDPLRFLADTTAGRCCLVGGVLLAAAGVAWIERLAGQVAKRT